jgi:hypothetical protein
MTDDWDRILETFQRPWSIKRHTGNYRIEIVTLPTALSEIRTYGPSISKAFFEVLQWRLSCTSV